MNLYLYKLPKREEINTSYLTKLYSNKGNRGGIAFKGHLSKNNMNFNSKNIYVPQTLERKFQFNYIVRTFNSLINNRKSSTNSVETKGSSQRLYLPIIKEFNLTKNTNNNNSRDNELRYKSYIKDINVNNPNSLRNIPLYDNSENNNEELIDITSKSKNILEKSNSTISQSLINNKSVSSSKMFNENEKDKIIFRNLSHGSIFEAYKKQYLASIKEYKSRNKIAETNFKEQLEKIKNEKFKKSKNEEFFKEYEIKFNPNKITQKLKNEFQFFQNGEIDLIKKKSIDEAEIRRKKLFKDIKNNEDKKNNSNYYEMKHNGIKPSQRIIQNMIRKEKKIELYEKSLIDFKDDIK